MTGELAIGLVGCGRLAQVGYLPALRAAPGVRLAAVADPHPQRRATVAGHLPGFDRAAALLDSVALDGLVLATPAAAHLADARLAAARGVPVLVEKPPAGNLAEAAELCRLEPRPWLGFNRRFGDGPSLVRRRIGHHGSADLLLDLRYRRRSWGAHEVGDDALLDLGPHLVDLTRWLLASEVVSVDAATVTPEEAGFALTTERGKVRVSCASHRPHRERIEARDERGSVVARHSDGGLVKGLRSRLAARHRPHPLVASLARQLEAFARVVQGVSPDRLATAADGLAAMVVLDAIRSCAAQDGQPVPVVAAAA